eukprot:TRINITY_DN91865_c0_g1_i1.p1 TRINITY_DN91865_c0_g1~~TRINITY_DN91865_c0_g1_i1.p1  ORF type:complete len:493 (+),score=94.84 TRINITY_DN91865_c0_g1_i1:52-1530(+)
MVGLNSEWPQPPQVRPPEATVYRRPQRGSKPSSLTDIDAVASPKDVAGRGTLMDGQARQLSYESSASTAATPSSATATALLDSSLEVPAEKDGLYRRPSKTSKGRSSEAKQPATPSGSVPHTPRLFSKEARSVQPQLVSRQPSKQHCLLQQADNATGKTGCLPAADSRAGSKQTTRRASKEVPLRMGRRLSTDSGFSRWERQKGVDSQGVALKQTMDRLDLCEPSSGEAGSLAASAVPTFSPRSPSQAPPLQARPTPQRRTLSKESTVSFERRAATVRDLAPLGASADASNGAEGSTTVARAVLLTRTHGIPMQDIQDEWEKFRELKQVKEGLIDRGTFEAELRRRCNLGDTGKIPAHLWTVHAAMSWADAINFEDFVIWWNSVKFSEEVMVPPEDRWMRQVAKSLDISIWDVEKMHEAFKRFDTDRSGSIDRAEFKDLLHELLKCELEQMSPAYIAYYWRQVDLDNDGVVSFKEFARWYYKELVETGLVNL